MLAGMGMILDGSIVLQLPYGVPIQIYSRSMLSDVLVSESKCFISCLFNVNV